MLPWAAPVSLPVVVSNQSGVGRGLLTAGVLELIHARMSEAVAAAGGEIAAIYHCPHTPTEGCECRKPAAGMVRKMERDLGYSARGAPLIGDKLSDIELARSVGARPILVRTGYGATSLAALSGPTVEVLCGPRAGRRGIDPGGRGMSRLRQMLGSVAFTAYLFLVGRTVQ